MLVVFIQELCIISRLNSKRGITEINVELTDWDLISEIGIYSGMSAKNSPVSFDGWINAICLRSNGNGQFLYVISFVDNGTIFTRQMSNGQWLDWIKVK